MPGLPGRAFKALENWAEPFAFDAATEFLRLRRRVDATVIVDLATMVGQPPAGRVLLVHPAGRPLPAGLPTTLRVVHEAPRYWVGEGRFVPRSRHEGPEYGGVYDRCGELIPESMLRRGPDLVPKTRTRPRLPDDFTTVDEPVIFVGPTGGHFGHFITESVGRLWYALDVRPDLRIIVEPAGAPLPVMGQYLAAAGISESRLVTPAVPTRFVEVHVPESTCVLGGLVHDRHVELSRAVASALLRDDVPPETDQPLYLARTRLDRNARGTYGERPIVREMTRHGARVVHPQRLDFREQVRLVNAHRTIVGQLGSAHYLSMFALKSQHHVYFCDDPWGSYPMFDHALGNRAHYVASNREVRSTRRRGATITDVPFALAQLRELGLLPRTST